MDELLLATAAAAVAFIILVAFMACLLAFPVMLLWNQLMPDLFGLIKITFVQALKLNLLCGILFKSHSSSKSK